MEVISPTPLLACAATWLFIAASCEAQNIGINTSGIAPNTHALLDVNNEGAQRGVLLPRLSTYARTGMTGLGLTDEGLTVYDSTTKTYWYWDGTEWKEMAAASGAGWGLLGNSSTDGAVNFLGTTDMQPIMIRTAGVERIRITTKGQLEPLNTGQSVFVGAGAGTNDDGTLNQNVFIGESAGTSSQSAQHNTALGFEALRDNSDRDELTAIGYAALSSNTFGYENCAIGSQALRLNTNGSWNTAVGTKAIRSNSSGWGNVAVGHGALQTNATGWLNCAVGIAALGNNATGGDNVALGSYTLLANTTGTGNLAAGNNCLMTNTSGDLNTAVGKEAMRDNASGVENVALGYRALSMNVDGSSNTALGGHALEFNNNGHLNLGVGDLALARNNGHGNIGIGHAANFFNVNGSNNTIIGHEAGHGYTLHDKSGNVFIGYRAGYDEVGSNKLYIENSSSAQPLIYGDFAGDFVRINHNLGIGASDFGGGQKVLAFQVGMPPMGASGNTGMIYAASASGTVELYAMDGAGNSTVISPHNFTLAPRSEAMAWSFYSENARLDRKVNVDMMRAMRLIEQLTGEKLVYMTSWEGQPVEELERENRSLVQRLERLESALAHAQATIDALLKPCEPNP